MFSESIDRGIQDIKTGNLFSTSEVKDKIQEARKSRI